MATIGNAVVCERFRIEARRIHGWHTYRKELFIRTVIHRVDLAQRLRRMADTAASRGYDAAVIHVCDDNGTRTEQTVYAVCAAEPKLPWRNAK